MSVLFGYFYSHDAANALRRQSRIEYKMLSYRRETALQGALALAKSGTGRQYITDIIGRKDYTESDRHSNPVLTLTQKAIEFAEKRKIRAITPFKVIRNQSTRKPVCDFMLVINSNGHPISYRFGVIAAYCVQILDTLRS